MDKRSFISFFKDSLWTDSVKYALQWFFNGDTLLDAHDTSYQAVTTGNYWVQSKDTLSGCIENSDSLYIAFSGIENDFIPFNASVYPNPNSGRFTIKIYSKEMQIFNFKLMNILEEEIYEETFKPWQNEFEKNFNFSGGLPGGVYFLKISNRRGVITLPSIHIEEY